MTDGIQSTGVRLVEKQRELVDYRQKLLNVELTLEAGQACLFVFDICNRISVQIANKKYFSALRMIQELQSTHLKLIRKFSFSKMISIQLFDSRYMAATSSGCHQRSSAPRPQRMV